MVGVLPFFHIYGQTVVMNCAPARRGDDRHAAALRPRAVPRPDRSGTASRAPTSSPPIVLALAKHPVVDDYDVSTLQHDAVGAAPLGAELVENAAAERLDCAIEQGYGLTEAAR